MGVKTFTYILLGALAVMGWYLVAHASVTEEDRVELEHLKHG